MAMETGAALAAWVLWASLAFLAYVYAIYPLILAVVGRLRARPSHADDIVPKVSLLIAAYNEEDVIAERLDNALSSDYPREALEIIVASDGSTDGTDDIVATFADRGVVLLSLPRQGKIAALNAAVTEATGEIFLFSDANSMTEPSAIRSLVRSFADADVGGVVGSTGYRVPTGTESSGRGERLYWRYDRWLKSMESRIGSVVAAHGGLYAVRSHLYRKPPDAAATDDFMISTAVVEQGYRLVFEPMARAWEVTAASAGGEFRRRVRLMTRGWHGVGLRRQLLNPFRHGWYALVLLSHKVLRRLTPVALLLVAVSSVALFFAGRGYRMIVLVQLALVGAAIVGGLTRRMRIGNSRVLYVPFYFCVANLAALVALSNAVRRKRIGIWNPQRGEAGA